MAKQQNDSNTAVAENPKQDSKQTTTPIVPVGAEPQAATRGPALKTAPPPTQVSNDPGVSVGDMVLYVAPSGWFAGVVNPQVQAAVVAGIMPSGRLTLFVFGFLPKTIAANIEEDPSGKRPNTWHKKPANTVTCSPK